jgi:hypothetical protein
MKILILAITHDHQRVLVGSEFKLSDFVQKTEVFRALVKTNIAAFKPDLICEETNPAFLSIAQLEAFNNTPRIPWKNINMTPQERLEAGIWEALLERPSSFDIDTETVTYYRVPEDDVREDFFRGEILTTAKEIGAQRVLVLCGGMHAEPLRLKLEGDGREIEINDEFTPVKNWRD